MGIFMFNDGIEHEEPNFFIKAYGRISFATPQKKQSKGIKYY